VDEFDRWVKPAEMVHANDGTADRGDQR